MRVDSERLLDILDAIKAIQDQVKSREEFDGDKMIRVWCLASLPG